MLIELDLAPLVRPGATPEPDRQFPSREAADAYHVVRAWLGRSMSSSQARQRFSEAWPGQAPWAELKYWAMVKTAAKIIRERGL
jgi:hypothetical protein